MRIDLAVKSGLCRRDTGRSQGMRILPRGPLLVFNNAVRRSHHQHLRESSQVQGPTGMAPLLLPPSLQRRGNPRGPESSLTKHNASKACRSSLTRTSVPNNLVMPQLHIPDHVALQPPLSNPAAPQDVVIRSSPRFDGQEEPAVLLPTQVETPFVAASGSAGSVCSCQCLSNLQRATLSMLRQILPLWTWNEVLGECREPILVYGRLYEMAARRQIKGIRLEANKQEWIAAWTDKDRRERRKYFSIRQQGSEQAWYLAVRTRAEALNDGARVRWGTSRRRPAQSPC